MSPVLQVGTAATTKHVLLVDDDPSVLMTLPEVLATAGLQVETAASLAEAQDCLARRRFDLLVTDLCLTGRDDNEGLDLLAWTRARFPKTKMVVLTGYSTTETRDEAMRRGAADYWNKSLAISGLLERLRALL